MKGVKGANVVECPTCKQEMKDFGEWPDRNNMIVHRWHCVSCNIFQAFPVREVREGDIKHG
jgi:hypothetical protein